MNKIEFTPIGIVTNRVVEPVDENWGSVISRLTINPEFAKGIMALDQFSHAVVITFMNKLNSIRQSTSFEGHAVLNLCPKWEYSHNGQKTVQIELALHR